MGFLALEAELRLAVNIHGTPSGLVSSLAVVANGGRLPGLIKGLEVEGVVSVLEERAVTLVVEELGVLETTLSLVVVGANCEFQLVLRHYDNHKYWSVLPAVGQPVSPFQISGSLS